MKATAVAHPIQGLIKYHGLKDVEKRIPYHDSISVCANALSTKTTVETVEESTSIEIMVNERTLKGVERRRVENVLTKLRELTGYSGGFRVVSRNSIVSGKGLGFSASGFAALGLAAAKALGADVDRVSLSEIVRYGAGSATRSLAGGFAIWHADRNGRSYAEQLETFAGIDFSMVILPVDSDVKTDEAHIEVLSSILFKARLENIKGLIRRMRQAVRQGDTALIGKLAEEDTLNLHAITMTGKSHMVLWEPCTVEAIKEVVKLREQGVPAWYSIDTGPSVFVNTYRENVETIAERFRGLGFKNVLTSDVGGPAVLTGDHLF